MSIISGITGVFKKPLSGAGSPAGSPGAGTPAVSQQPQAGPKDTVTLSPGSSGTLSAKNDTTFKDILDSVKTALKGPDQNGGTHGSVFSELGGGKGIQGVPPVSAALAGSSVQHAALPGSHFSSVA